MAKLKNCLINIILSTAENIIYISKNYALYENKETDGRTLLTNLIKLHKIYTANRGLFEEVFINGAEMVKIMENKDLEFAFQTLGFYCLIYICRFVFLCLSLLLD